MSPLRHATEPGAGTTPAADVLTGAPTGPSEPWAVRTVTDLLPAIGENAAGHDRDGTAPVPALDLLWSAGLGALTVPVAAGGRGAPLSEVAGAVRLLGSADPSVALIMAMHWLHLETVNAPGGPWSPDMIELLNRTSLGSAPALVNVIAAEPELGSGSLGRAATTAVAVARGDERYWELTGRKTYCTGSTALGFFLVSATVPESDGTPTAGVTLLVPADAPGVTIEHTWDHLGLRASASHDVVLDRVLVPVRLATEPSPLRGRRANAGRSGGWLVALLLSVYTGVAEAATSWLADYLHQRVPSGLGTPLAQLPTFQRAVGEIDSQLYAATRLLDALVDEVERAGPDWAGDRVGMLKSQATAHLIEAVSTGATLIGNAALSRRMPYERHLRDVLCSRIHAPHDDIVFAGAGRSRLGL
jgi:alkylation response protein AidB-like acyl-CoA dehydrogenase